MFQIKFFLTFLFKVLINNPWKITFLASIIFCFNYANNAQLIEVQSPIIQNFKNDGKTFCVVKSENSYSVEELKPDTKITNNMIVTKQVSPLSIISTIVGLLLLIFFLVSTFVPEEDFNWNFSDIWDSTRFKFIEVFSENDVYYYTYRGRLLSRKEFQLSEWDLIRLLESPLNIYPPFEGTKADRRNKKIEKIFEI